MVNLQITYNDLENLIETAREDSPYLVYSYKLRKMPNPSGYNKLNDKSLSDMEILMNYNSLY